MCCCNVYNIKTHVTAGDKERKEERDENIHTCTHTHNCLVNELVSVYEYLYSKAKTNYLYTYAYT